MEGDHERLILGADGSDGDLLAIPHLPATDVLGRIRADGELGQLLFRGLWIVEDDAGVESDEVIGGGKERVDVNFLDPALLGDELAEADHELLEGGQVHGFAAAHALERLVDLGALHHALGQGRVERGQCQGFVLEYFDELAAHSEEQHGSELRVNAAAQDDFVTFAELDHLLDGDTLEVLGALLLGDGGR